MVQPHVAGCRVGAFAVVLAAAVGGCTSVNPPPTREEAPALDARDLSPQEKRYNQFLDLRHGPTRLSYASFSTPAMREPFAIAAHVTDSAVRASKPFTTCRVQSVSPTLSRGRVSAWLPDNASWYDLEVMRYHGGIPNAGPAIDRVIAVERGWQDGRWVRAQVFEASVLTVRTGRLGAPEPPKTVALPAGDSLTLVLRELASRVLALTC